MPLSRKFPVPSDVRTSKPTGRPDLGSVAEAIYAYALQHGGITADNESVCDELGLPTAVVAVSIRELLALRLLREERNGDHVRMVPVSPEVAAASLISPIRDEIYRCQTAIRQIQGKIDAFRPHYEQARSAQSAGECIDVLHDEVELAGHLHLAERRCRRELVAFRPECWLGLERVIAMAKRGVRVRLLLQHARRSDLRARAQLKELTACHGEVRTTGRLPKQLLIFDEAVAFLLREEDASGPVGVVIRQADTVRLLRGVIETTWETAHPYSTASIGYNNAANDLHHAIVELLADGLTDEAIARRLGVSVRTCRRHIATVLKSLDAISRFQAGVRAAAAGMVDSRQQPRDTPSQVAV